MDKLVVVWRKIDEREDNPGLKWYEVRFKRVKNQEGKRC